MSGQKSKLKKMDLFVRAPDRSQIEKDGFYLSSMYVRTHFRTNVRTRQDKDFNCVRTQVKIAKDGFYLCPDISQNRKNKIWIIYVQSWIPTKNKIWIIYVRTQVKIAKDGFDLCPGTSQNRKRWI